MAEVHFRSLGEDTRQLCFTVHLGSKRKQIGASHLPPPTHFRHHMTGCFPRKSSCRVSEVASSQRQPRCRKGNEATILCSAEAQALDVREQYSFVSRAPACKAEKLAKVPADALHTPKTTEVEKEPFLSDPILPPPPHTQPAGMDSCLYLIDGGLAPSA